MKWALIALTLAVGQGTGGTQGWGQEEKKVVTPPTNLDTKNIDVTALYLCKAMLHQESLQAEARRTGNFVKLNDYQEKLGKELKGWKGTEVKWAVQVSSIGAGDSSSTISIIKEYVYKNKGTVFIALRNEPPYSLMRDRDDDNDGQRRNFSINFDEQWAKTLKRGDYIEMTGIIKQVDCQILSSRPEVHVLVTAYGKYTPPKKK